VLNKIPLNNIISLGSVYPFVPVSLFNLLAYQKTPQALALLRNQLFATILTIVTIFALVIGYSYMQSTTARNQLNRAKQSAITLISQEFDITDRNLNTAVDTAQQKLEESASIWGSISGPSRLYCLKYLQELCIKIDRDGIGLDLKKLTMNKKFITLNGRVRDFPALKTLEEELSDSKLFTLITVSQEPKFDEIRLAIKNTSEEPA
jgi:Tfp pilus assembly protein PilN